MDKRRHVHKISDNKLSENKTENVRTTNFPWLPGVSVYLTGRVMVISPDVELMANSPSGLPPVRTYVVLLLSMYELSMSSACTKTASGTSGRV